MNNVYVLDTSVIIERKIIELINEKKIKGKIILPMAVLAELEHQANLNQTEGFLGLDEVKAIRELTEKKKITLEYFGEKPQDWRIKGARLGAIDDLIREAALKLKATLVTGDKVQALVAEAMGVETILILPDEIKKAEKLDIEKLFDNETMSIHLKEDTIPLAKKGAPGKWEFTPLRKTKFDVHIIKEFSADIIEKTKTTEGAFIEMSNKGTTIVQFKNFRIVINRPPFSDGWEITAVRPVATLEIEDYKISPKLKERLSTSATGILISGSPGSGKTTFASALAKFYLTKNKLVKTIESPRDLQVPDEVIQYSKNLGSKQDIHNVMLLTRPDYTIFDEMRTTEDFRLYADLRLAGIGLAGVIHATGPIDAIQRFVGRIEIGMIPQTIDTVLFIDKGRVGKVLELVMKVKVPTGMTEKDLARPVVEVTDFETGDLEYEIYRYSDQTVVIPIGIQVRTSRKSRSLSYRVKEVKKYVNFYFNTHVKAVELTISGERIATLPVDRTRTAKVYKKSKLGKRVLDALMDIEEIKFTR